VWTALAVIAGCLLGRFFMAFHSTQGPQLGLPQMIQSRPQFGYVGALLVWAVALIAYLGYNAFNDVLAAQTLHQLNGAVSATSATAIIVFSLAVVLAVLGYDQIHIAQRTVAYLMIAILSVCLDRGAHGIKFPAAQWEPAEFAPCPSSRSCSRRPPTS
jgi:purine-cytosine permease-like protein